MPVTSITHTAQAMPSVGMGALPVILVIVGICVICVGAFLVTRGGGR